MLKTLPRCIVSMKDMKRKNVPEMAKLLRGKNEDETLDELQVLYDTHNADGIIFEDASKILTGDKIIGYAAVLPINDRNTSAILHFRWHKNIINDNIKNNLIRCLFISFKKYEIDYFIVKLSSENETELFEKLGFKPCSIEYATKMAAVGSPFFPIENAKFMSRKTANFARGNNGK